MLDMTDRIQDSHFTMSYDRPSSTALCGADIPYRKTSAPGHRSYAESMFRIIALTQEIIRGRLIKPQSNLTWNAIQSYKEEVARINADGALHLRDRQYCLSKTQHLERLALKLHSSYITSELCRPALKEPPNSPNTHARAAMVTSVPEVDGAKPNSPKRNVKAESAGALPAQLRRDCIAGLEGCIDAYLELHSISSQAARSWIGIQRAISAAFLLGITQESHHDQHIHLLLRDLERVISERTKMESAFMEIPDLQSPGINTVNASATSDFAQQARSHGSSTADSGLSTQTGDSPQWAKSMTQSLKALSKMNAALASPRVGSLPRPPPSYPSSTFTGAFGASEKFWPGQISPGTSGAGLVMPATPESSGSSDWNYTNLEARAAEYVTPGLWGS